MKDNTQDLTVQTCSHHLADVFYFSFQRYGWAILFLDEETGSAVIRSDWGDYSHTWPAHSRGESTLREFFINASPHYMAEKFFYGRDRERYNEEKTKQTFKECIADRHLTNDEERALLDEIEELFDGCAGRPAVVLPECMSKELGNVIEDAGALIQYEDTPEYLILRDSLLPAIIEELKKQEAVK